MGVNLRQMQTSVVGATVLFALGALGCGAPQSDLQARIKKTAADLRKKDADGLYLAHHMTIQAELDRKAFAERIARNPREAEELAGALETAKGTTSHTAMVTLRNGEKVGLVFEKGRWAVHEGPFGAVDLTTPWAALRAFRSALLHESLGSLRTVLGGELRAKRDFAVQMLLEQTEDVHALKFTHDEATGVFKESATFETPAGVHIVFVKEGEHWYLEHVQAPNDDD